MTEKNRLPQKSSHYTHITCKYYDIEKLESVTYSCKPPLVKFQFSYSADVAMDFLDGRITITCIICLISVMCPPVRNMLSSLRDFLFQQRTDRELHHMMQQQQPEAKYQQNQLVVQLQCFKYKCYYKEAT